ncbi:hypothetical protein ACFDAU_01620 [Sulfuriferula sp. GW1]|uniref:hypothetical protein n=1 Tax=Sulfuriferula sp. GW1 TaxID=3345111 RepID=UPI0039AEAF0F
MKFPHIPLGAQFEFDGKAYTKISPLLAAAEDGSGQRVIPRYAVLRPIGAPVPATPAQHSRQLDPDKVRVAFASFEADALRLLDEACGEDVDRRAALKAELVEAGQRFRDAL